MKTKFTASQLATVFLTGLIATNSWAATLSGVRFINNTGTPLANPIYPGNNTPYYTPKGYVIFQPLNRANLTPFSTTISGNQYATSLSDGDYEVWQYVNPTQITSNLQWGDQGNALKITVTGNVITYTGTPDIVPGNKLDFPVSIQNPATIDPALIGDKCDPLNTSNNPDITPHIICGTAPLNLPSTVASCDTNISATDNWPTNANTHATDDVFIYGTVKVTAFNNGDYIQVNSLCNYGQLVGEDNTNAWPPKDINIEFKEYFVNLENSSVIAADSTNDNLTGGSINLFSPDTLIPIPAAHGDLYNLGEIRAGAGKTFAITSSNSRTFTQSQSKGGNINLEMGYVYQYKDLEAGVGSDITFNNFWDAWHWEHAAGTDGPTTGSNPSPLLATPSSSGGNLTIEAPNFIAGQSSTGAGQGGNMVITNNDDCGNNPSIIPTSWCRNELEGGQGGDLLIGASGTIFFANSALQGNSVYVEPDSLELTAGTTIVADKEIVLYGGDDFELKIHGLAENALQAGTDIILAVGAGGTIDLTGNSGQIFKVGNNGHLKIYSDTPVILDAGITLSELSGDASVIQAGAKIIRHVVINGRSSYLGEVNNQQEITVDIINSSPYSDTFSLSIENNQGLTINELPIEITVDGLKSQKVVFYANYSSSLNTITPLVLKAVSKDDVTAIDDIVINLITSDVVDEDIVKDIIKDVVDEDTVKDIIKDVVDEDTVKDIIKDVVDEDTVKDIIKDVVDEDTVKDVVEDISNNLQQTISSSDLNILLDTINAIPTYKNSGLIFQQNDSLDLISKTKEGGEYILNALSIKKGSNKEAQIITTETGEIIIITANGTEINTQRVKGKGFNKLLLNRYKLTPETSTGDLIKIVLGNKYILAQPYINRIIIKEGKEGINEIKHPDIENAKLFQHTFIDNEVVYQQVISAKSPHVSELLAAIKGISEKESVFLDTKNSLYATIGGNRYQAVVDYIVTQGNPPKNSQLTFEKGALVNQVIVVYKNGDRQTLMYKIIN